jgi:hypothetical protein
MSTESTRYPRILRHTANGMAVTRTMGTMRAAVPFVRALILATLVTLLIMVGLPAMLAIAAAAH